MQAQSQTMKKFGHNRRPSCGKIMPISTLLDNLMTTPSNHFDSLAKDASNSTASFESFTHNLKPNERSDGNQFGNIIDLTTNFIEGEIFNNVQQQQQSLPSDIVDVNKTFLKCVNYHPRDMNTNGESDIINAKNVVVPDDDDVDENIDRLLLGNNTNAPCSICSNKVKSADAIQTFDFQQPLNVLCEKLCDKSCNTSTKTCQSTDDMHTNTSHLSNDTASTKSMNELDAKQDAERILARSNSNRQEFLASMLDENEMGINGGGDGGMENNDDGTDSIGSMETNISCDEHIVPLTVENLKQFNENYFRHKLAIAEALANTSAMTSPAARRRLAARKMEMSLNTPDFVYDVENAEYIPPKDLLMYLVR